MRLDVDTETGEVVVRNHIRTFRTHVDDVVAIERVWRPFAGVVLRLTDGRSLRIRALAPPNPAFRPGNREVDELAAAAMALITELSGDRHRAPGEGWDPTSRRASPPLEHGDSPCQPRTAF